MQSKASGSAAHRVAPMSGSIVCVSHTKRKQKKEKVRKPNRKRKYKIKSSKRLSMQSSRFF
jgi:nickel-dependent lactate racemase